MRDLRQNTDGHRFARGSLDYYCFLSVLILIKKSCFVIRTFIYGKNFTMAYSYTVKKTIEFSETDMAGIVHFSNFFRYMEMAEHAFLRSLGLSVHFNEAGQCNGWARVHAECDYLSPLHFEEEVEIELFVREIRRKTINYFYVFKKFDGEEANVVATGTITAVSVLINRQDNSISGQEIPTNFKDVINICPPEYYQKHLKKQ